MHRYDIELETFVLRPTSGDSGDRPHTAPAPDANEFNSITSTTTAASDGTDLPYDATTHVYVVQLD